MHNDDESNQPCGSTEAIEWNSMHNACVHSSSRLVSPLLSDSTISSLKGDSTVTNNTTVQALPFWEDQTDKSEKGKKKKKKKKKKKVLVWGNLNLIELMEGDASAFSR